MDPNTISRSKALRIIFQATDTPKDHEALAALMNHPSQAVVRRASHKLNVQFPFLRGESFALFPKLPAPMKVQVSRSKNVKADDVLPETEAVKTPEGAYMSIAKSPEYAAAVADLAAHKKRSAAAKKGAATKAKAAVKKVAKKTK